MSCCPNNHTVNLFNLHNIQCPASVLLLVLPFVAAVNPVRSDGRRRHLHLHLHVNKTFIKVHVLSHYSFTVPADQQVCSALQSSTFSFSVTFSFFSTRCISSLPHDFSLSLCFSASLCVSVCVCFQEPSTLCVDTLSWLLFRLGLVDFFFLFSDSFFLPLTFALFLSFFSFRWSCSP